jgi:hypothetical protein
LRKKVGGYEACSDLALDFSKKGTFGKWVKNEMLKIEDR